MSMVDEPFRERGFVRKPDRPQPNADRIVDPTAGEAGSSRRTSELQLRGTDFEARDTADCVEDAKSKHLAIERQRLRAVSVESAEHVQRLLRQVGRGRLCDGID